MIITVRMPARLHRWTASRASARGGSCKPISPRKVSSCSITAGSASVVEWAFSQGQHAQRLVGQQGTRLEHAGTVPVSQGGDLLRGPDASAPLQNHLRGAFHKGPGTSAPLADDRHAFALGVKGQRRQAGHLRLDGLARDPAFRSDHQEGDLGGITDRRRRRMLRMNLGIIAGGSRA